MPMCIVKGCTNASSRKSHRQEVLEESMKITFHVLPKDRIRRLEWLNNLGLQESCMPKQAVVCSIHFKNKDFDRTSLSCTRLRSHAIPYVQVPKDEEEGNNEECKKVSNQESLSSCLRLVLKQDANTYISSQLAGRVVKKHTMDNISFDKPFEKVLRIEPQPKNECLQKLLQTRDKSVQVKIPCVDRFTSVSPERIFHSPEKEELRNHLAKMKQKHQNELKLWKQRHRRCIERIRRLKAMLRLAGKADLLTNEHIEDDNKLQDT